jgi:hypothetical protein
MENMISIPESRYMELLEIEKKYNGDSDIKEVFNKKSLSDIYIELNSVVNAGLSMENTGYNNDIWHKVYDKVFGKHKISGKWRELVPDFSWYDPDASYYDDVMAFYHAVQDYVVTNNIVSEYNI